MPFGVGATEAMLQTLKEMGDAEDIEFNEEEFGRSKPLFETIIKALIGRDVYDNATYFKVYNRHDPIFREALRVLES